VNADPHQPVYGKVVLETRSSKASALYTAQSGNIEQLLHATSSAIGHVNRPGDSEVLYQLHVQEEADEALQQARFEERRLLEADIALAKAAKVRNARVCRKRKLEEVHRGTHKTQHRLLAENKSHRIQ
jgi:hypothetical protein